MRRVRISTIVEGFGEVEALPLLLRRIASEASPDVYLEIPKPVRVGRQKICKSRELERYLELAARTGGDEGRILLLLDADEDCPVDLARALLERARKQRPDRMTSVVLAKTEFESWFLAAADSITGKRGLASDLSSPENPEAVKGAKEWLSRSMPRGQAYQETIDQAKLTCAFNLEIARQRSPSFDKLWREVERLLG